MKDFINIKFDDRQIQKGLGHLIKKQIDFAMATVHPFSDGASQQIICCEAAVTSSMDVDTVAVHVTKVDDGYTFDFQETGIGASAPISAQSGAITGVSNAVFNTAASAVKLSP